MKDRLVFDTTDVNTIADSDSVGAFVRSSSGALIESKSIDSADWLNVASALFDGSGVALTSSLVGGKQGLDVNILNAIAVSLDGVYDGGGNPTPDTVGMIAHGRGATPGAADQTFRSTGGAASADAVVAANVQALDVNAFGMAYNGTTWDRLRATSGALHISDGGGSLTVDAVNLDIRDLTHAADSVRLGDGTSLVTTTTVGGDVGLDVNVLSDPSLASTAIAAAAVTATTTAADVVASPLSARKYLFVYNNGNQRVFVGQSGVTSTSGFPVSPGSYLELRAGAAVDIEIVANSGSQNIRTLELA
jgi:hypothetical protein